MIIEGYVFIPYQGQFRFRFSSGAAETEMFFKSDAQYDKRLGVYDLVENYGDVRPCTCREFIYSGLPAQYEEKILEALESELMEALAADPTAVRKADIDTVRLFADSEAIPPVKLTVLRV